MSARARAALKPRLACLAPKPPLPCARFSAPPTPAALPPPLACAGPTVYDSAHVGHARNYLSFDIVRRVLEDYFGYNCLYVMNVTDVDDKIILRARRNHLLAAYRAAAQDSQQVFQDATAALAAAVDKQRGKVADAEAALADAAAEGTVPLPCGGSTSSSAAVEKRREELGTKVGEEALLLGKQEAAAAALAAAGAGAGVQRLLEVAGDALAEQLDRQLGATVTDPAIYRAHAARCGAVRGMAIMQACSARHVRCHCSVVDV